MDLILIMSLSLKITLLLSFFRNVWKSFSFITQGLQKPSLVWCRIFGYEKNSKKLIQCMGMLNKIWSLLYMTIEFDNYGSY